MPINFPGSPTNGQIYTYNGTSYYYDSGNISWTTSYVAPPATTIDVANNWANTVAVYANNWANTVGVNANNWANTKLANTGDIVFAGNLYYTTGHVGIGTSTPSATLDVVGTVSTAKAHILSQTLTDAATINWNAANGQIATVTLTAAGRTMDAPTNLKVGTYILHIIQDATGSRTITTWNAVFKWPGGIAPTLTTTANARDLISFVCDGTNLYGAFMPDVK